LNDARRGKRYRLIVALGALAGLGVWLLLRSDEPVTQPAVEEAAQPEVAAPPSPPSPRPQAPAPVAPRPALPEYETSDGIPIMPPGPNDPRPEGPVHPHPITEQHKRLYTENRMIAELNGAVDVRDGPGLRKLLAEYRAQYPEDDHDVQEGYEAIANCLEHPGEESRAAARRFGEEHRGSTTRRFVNRICLEGQ
jgi:hypothetical protein